ncbi:MAG: alpha/beta hydrolase [Deltaproteobacteria bacterium]|nr:alpha/beta hydrolase [Deltaproteobacteria bacterium]MBW2400763.1 alpha/beta hydrolase [Deltaproteobacteria bacterium]
MTSFVLVHGGAHGAWCWDRLSPHLLSDPRVDAVVAVDLTGHGARRAVKPLAAITVADYVDDVVREIEARDLREVVLVGHSLAGITIPRASARAGDRIRRLIYLSTSNPAVGQSIEDLMKHPLSPVSQGVDFQRMFCNDLDDEATAWLLAQLGPEPSGPMAEPVTPVVLPAELESTYILLERDEALPPALQLEQAHSAGVDEVVPFDAGHSAFVSRPRELADLLLRYA